MKTKTILTMDTVQSCDCIDFCPIEPFHSILAVGTYQLNQATDDNNEEKSKRIGRVYLLSIENNILTKLDQIELSGVLDIRWCAHKIGGEIILGIVNADGDFITYSLEDGTRLKEVQKLTVSQDLTLYLDWSTRLNQSSPHVTISDAAGSVNICAYQESDISLIHKIKAHSYESWVTCFNYWNPSIVYSGGDDCKFKGYDLRADAVQIFSSNIHTAGVTSLQSCLWKEELLLSGCYDGDLHSWDTRCMRHPVATTNIGSGVWRLRCEPFKKPLILCSSMHGGVLLMEVNSNDKVNVLYTYLKHESLAYGADWSWKKCDKYLVGSVSFYDHLMCIWEFDS